MPRDFVAPTYQKLITDHILNTDRCAVWAGTAGYIFANQEGQPYTDSGFKTMWNRVMHDYAKAGGVWFTTHDLRAYYVTEKGEKGENPETHKNPATTKRVYDRTRVVKVKPLG